MNSRLSILGSSIAFVLAASSLSAAQHEVHQPASADSDSAAQVAQCAQSQAVVTQILDVAMKRLEAARLTNSASAMRDAADDVQSALVDVRAQLLPCTQMQTGADAHAGDATANEYQAPQALPWTPVMQPGSTVPTPAAAAPPAATPGAVDPHAGHVMPTAPTTGSTKPVTPHTDRTLPAAPKPADVPVGHAAPSESAPPPADAPATAARTTPENPAARLDDLTCRPPIDPDTAPRATYMGKAYYFCTTADRDAFLQSPATYLQRHP